MLAYWKEKAIRAEDKVKRLENEIAVLKSASAVKSVKKTVKKAVKKVVKKAKDSTVTA